MQVHIRLKVLFVVMCSIMVAHPFAHAEDSVTLEFINAEGNRESVEVSESDPILALIDDTTSVAVKEAVKAYEKISNRKESNGTKISLVNREGYSTTISVGKSAVSAIKIFTRLSKRIDLRTIKRFLSKAQNKLGVQGTLASTAPSLPGLRDIGTLSNIKNLPKLGTTTLKSRGKSIQVKLLPNYIVRAEGDPNDPKFPDQWGLVKMNWGIPLPSNSDVIAVVADTGIWNDHEDLKDVIWTNPGEIPANSIDDDNNGYVDDVHGWNFSYNTNSPFDDHGHGTHVAGTFAAKTNNGIGVAGVSSASILPLKVLNSTGAGAFAKVLEGLRYAFVTIGKQKNKFAVVNMSLGAQIASTSDLTDLVREFESVYQASEGHGILIAAAGNSHSDNDQIPFFPAHVAHIAVAATQGNDTLAGFSNFGDRSVDVAAPGLGIVSTMSNGSYGVMSGTSMASPSVSGMVAAMKAQKPSAGIDEIVRVVNETCRQPASGSLKVGCGGVVDYDAALEAFGGDGHGYRTPTPTVTGTRTATPTPEDPNDPFAGLPSWWGPYPNPKFEAEILGEPETVVNVGDELQVTCRERNSVTDPWKTCNENQLSPKVWLGKYNGWWVYGFVGGVIKNGKFPVNRLKFPETPWEGKIIKQLKCGGPAWLQVEYKRLPGLRSYPKRWVAGQGTWGCESGTPRPTRSPTKSATPSKTPTRVRGTPTATPTSTPTHTPTIPPTPTPTVPISNMRILRTSPPMNESGVRVTTVTGRCWIASHTGNGVPCPRVEMHARNIVTREVTFVGAYSGRNVIDYEFNFTGLPSGRYETLFYGFNERGERQQNIGASVIVGSGEQPTPTVTPTRGAGATPTFTPTPRNPTATPTPTSRSTETPTVTPTRTPTATPTSGGGSCPIPRFHYAPSATMSVGNGHTVRLDVYTDYETTPGDDYYTWRRNGQDLSSTTPKIIRTENVAGNVQYSVKITRRCPGGATSEAISGITNLEVRPSSTCDAPRIITQPVSQTINQGEYALFSVQASRGLNYQWVARSPSGQESNVAYSDIPYIHVRGELSRNGYQYFVKITDGRCPGFTAQSVSATLSVR